MSWATLIATGVATAVSAYGSNKARQNANDLQKKQQPLQNMQMQNLQALQPVAGQLTGSGTQNLDMVQNYLRQIGSGNRAQTMQAMAPEINAATQGMQGAVSAQRGMFPRGGQSASAASNMPYQLQGQINNMMFGARPQAMQQLGQLGSNQTSLGLSAYGQGAGLTNSMLNYGLNAQNQMFNQGAQIGGGISSMVGPMLQYYMMNNRPSNTTSNSPYMLPNQNQYSMYGNMTPGASSDPYAGLTSAYGKGGPYSTPSGSLGSAGEGDD